MHYMDGRVLPLLRSRGSILHTHIPPWAVNYNNMRIMKLINAIVIDCSQELHVDGVGDERHLRSLMMTSSLSRMGNDDNMV